MFLCYFLYILLAAVASSLLGAGFAYVVAALSPEFVTDLFPKATGANAGRYAAAVGMVWGLFVGAAVMGFCLLLATVHQVVATFRRTNGAGV
jgi:hypothetical protein